LQLGTKIGKILVFVPYLVKVTLYGKVSRMSIHRCLSKWVGKIKINAVYKIADSLRRMGCDQLSD